MSEPTYEPTWWDQARTTLYALPNKAPDTSLWPGHKGGTAIGSTDEETLGRWWAALPAATRQEMGEPTREFVGGELWLWVWENLPTPGPWGPAQAVEVTE